MEIKAELQKPYTEDERINFIVEYNHNLGYEIRETETALEAWGYTPEELAEQRQADFERTFFNIPGFGWFRKVPKGYSSAVECLNLAFNNVSLLGKLPAETMIFYTQPDFTKPEECTEEWLVAHQTKNAEMTVEQFGQFYAGFSVAWNSTEHN